MVTKHRWYSFINCIMTNSNARAEQASKQASKSKPRQQLQVEMDFQRIRERLFWTALVASSIRVRQCLS